MTPPGPCATTWSVQHRHGSAHELHHAELGSGRRVVIQHVDAPALVLGSTQASGDVDASALDREGIALARRRSGGGAVLLVPGEHVWIDVTIGSDDPLWTDDVTSSSWWLGAAWAEWMESASPPAAGAAPTVHRGRLTERELSRVVCFAATGSGEVSVGDRKVVGISQRRTRSGARFQCVVHLRWDPSATLALLNSQWSRSVPLRNALSARVSGLDELAVISGTSADLGSAGPSVVEGLIAHLP